MTYITWIWSLYHLIKYYKETGSASMTTGRGQGGSQVEFIMDNKLSCKLSQVSVYD